jgi:hypothetical protein
VKWLRFGLGLLLLAGFAVLLALGPKPGPVLQRNLEQDVQATALFYMDLEEMQHLEQRLETMLANDNEHD